MLSLIGHAFSRHLLGYVITFCSFGVLGGLIASDPDFIIMAGVFLIAWAAGPAFFFFPQRAASERFLRTLTVTHREIVTSRFLANLVLLAFCCSIILLLILTVPRTAEETEVCLKFTCAALAWSLVAGGLAHLWLAKRGASIFAGLLLNVILTVVTISLLVTTGQKSQGLDTQDTLLVSAVTSPSWLVMAFLPLGGLWVHAALMKIAAESQPLDGE